MRRQNNPLFAILRYSCCFLLLVAGVVATPIRAATFIADFTNDSSYISDQTVVGQKGWIKRDIPSGNNFDAAILLDDGGIKALRLHSTAKNAQGQPDTGKTRTYVGVNFTDHEFAVPLVEVKVSIAWTGDATSGYGGLVLGRSVVNPLAMIGFDKNNKPSDKGIFVESDGVTDVLLASNLVKLGSYYDFHLVFDMEAKSFNLTMTGLDINGAEVNISRSGLAYAASFTEIDGITAVVSRGERREVWISSIEMNAIPEPSSIAVVSIGAGILFFRFRVRQRR